MIPLRDENPTKTFPLVTLLIILVNCAVFGYEISLGEHAEEGLMRFGAVPHDIINPGTPLVFLTLITSLFFHIGLLHLAGNMLYLWVFGNNIEDRLGHARFLAFYLICGVLASLGHIAAVPDARIPLIGASGAVSGVLGAYLLLYPRAKVLVLVPLVFIWPVVKIQAAFFLVFWIVMQFLYSATAVALADSGRGGGVAWMAHVVGFFSGMVLLRVFTIPGRQRRRYDYPDT